MPDVGPQRVGLRQRRDVRADTGQPALNRVERWARQLAPSPAYTVGPLIALGQATRLTGPESP